jgi:hypothetical protein
MDRLSVPLFFAPMASRSGRCPRLPAVLAPPPAAAFAARRQSLRDADGGGGFPVFAGRPARAAAGEAAARLTVALWLHMSRSMPSPGHPRLRRPPSPRPDEETRQAAQGCPFAEPGWRQKQHRDSQARATTRSEAPAETKGHPEHAQRSLLFCFHPRDISAHEAGGDDEVVSGEPPWIAACAAMTNREEPGLCHQLSENSRNMRPLNLPMPTRRKRSQNRHFRS